MVRRWRAGPGGGARLANLYGSTETIVKITRDQPEPIRELNAEVPAELERIIRKCLEKDPERRFQSAKDVRNELADLELRGIAEGCARQAGCIGLNDCQVGPRVRAHGPPAELPAISQADTPVFDELYARWPSARLEASRLSNIWS